MQVQTTDGITITLTDEQIAQIDSQVKAKVPMSIMDRVKSWEDACLIIKPTWYMSGLGMINDSSSKSVTPLDAANISTQKRALSLLAYAQLSVIADALNEGWEPDWTNDSCKHSVWYNSMAGTKYFKTTQYQHWRYQNILFKSQELASYTIAQFPDLWKQFFMID